MATLIRSWMPLVLMVLSPYTGGVSAMETCGPQSGDCLLYGPLWKTFANGLSHL